MKKNKPGITIDAYRKFGDEKYKKLAEHGYEACNYTLERPGADYYTCPIEEFTEMMKHERALADEAGITIHQVHGPFRGPEDGVTEEERAQRFEDCKRAMYGATLLGAKYLILHPLLPFGCFDIGTKYKETWEINLQFYRKLVKVAKEYDIIICIENLGAPNFCISYPAHTRELVEKINSAYCRVCLDVGHVNVLSYWYDDKVILEDEIRRLGRHIKTLHLHDNRDGGDFHMPPYTGTIDWDKLTRALADVNFTGVMLLETIIPSDNEEDFIEVAKNARKLADEVTAYRMK